ncbi:hypothetical protein ACGFIK_21820 [Micromonospora sp. NPDC048871]|uniref:hypothetical protein n=1 Tax=Micromonospora TaxID=1873 RepID=UPI003646F1E6
MASTSGTTTGINLLDQATTACPTLTKTWIDVGSEPVIEHCAALDVETVTKFPQVEAGQAERTHRRFSVVNRRGSPNDSLIGAGDGSQSTQQPSHLSAIKSGSVTSCRP